ncbi:MAG: HAMP domain-containing sensor histidine kinase [Pseudomonadota bacterium]
MTPEAVLHRYLTLVNDDVVDHRRFVGLVGLDADLLTRWLRLTRTPVDPRAVQRAVEDLEPWTFVDLAQAQAWAVLPPGDALRLSFHQWRLVLRNACAGQALATALDWDQSEAEALRWRLLLAISGVMNVDDAVLASMVEFRGARPELLEDAPLEQRILAVVDAMDVEEPARVAAIAAQLLGLSNGSFERSLGDADALCDRLVRDAGLVDALNVQWSENLWQLQQVNLLAGLFLQSGDPEGLFEAHDLAAKTLFTRPPQLFLLDGTSGRLLTGLTRGVAIPVQSESSTIARALREAREISLKDSDTTAVVDRRVLRGLETEQATAVPLIEAGDQLGVLLYPEDDDVDQRFLIDSYSQALARWLSASRDSASDGMRMLTQFREREEKRLREIVHEANNPLSIVNNYLHILELRAGSEPQTLEQLRLISREIKRATEVMQSVRDVPKAIAAEAQTARLVPVDFDLNHLLRQVAEVHRGLASEQGAGIGVNLDRGVLMVCTDEQRLIQILSNLIKNALEAISPGDAVRLSTLGGVYREGREGFEVIVEDSGPGLSRAVLERLYEPKQSTKGSGHAGLGLHIVHRLVREIDASIDVRTSAGQGTAFTLFLPKRLP